MLGQNLTRQRVNLRDPFHFIPPKLNPVRRLSISRHNLQRIAPHPEDAPPQFQVIPFILNINQVAQNGIPAVHLPSFQFHRHLSPRFRITNTINARNRRHNDNILPAHQVGRRRQPQPVNLFINICFFFDIQVMPGNISFRLVIIIIADEVGDGVFREKLFELAV